MTDYQYRVVSRCVPSIEECIQHLKDYKLAIHILDDDGWREND